MAEKLLEDTFLQVNLSDLIKNQGGRSGAQSNIAPNSVQAPAPAGATSSNTSSISFLTVDLTRVGKKTAKTTADGGEADGQKADADAADEVAATADNQDLNNITDWDAEYTRRVDENAQMDKESRISMYDLENKFFKDFYTAEWKDEDLVVKLVKLGEDLRVIFKTLGFNKNNPIYSFFKQDYVIKELLLTNRINPITFTALYDAIAEKLIADSEFMTKNDYNLIYCRALYDYKPADMLAYFKIQKRSLPTNKSSYSKEMQASNRRALYAVPDLVEKDPDKRIAAIKRLPLHKIPYADDKGTTLNSVTVAGSLVGITIDHDTAGEKSNANLDSRGRQSLIAKLDSLEKKFAAIQYVFMSTGNAQAQKALKSSEFHGIDSVAVAKATIEIADDLPKGKLSANHATNLVREIMDSITSGQSEQS